MKRTVLYSWMAAISLLFVLPTLAQNDPSSATGDTGTVVFNYRGNNVTYVTVRAADGKIWLQQDLGATKVADSTTDAAAYGHLFQFGRWDDGHQLRTSATAPVASLSASNPAGLGSGSSNFYLGSNPNDWWGAGSPGDSWSGTTASSSNGIDPCAAIGPGWHLPSVTEWGSLLTSESITNLTTANSSGLKLIAGGQREGSLGNLQNVGSSSAYWASTPSGVYAKDVSIFSSSINPSDDAYRSYALCVRCVTTCTGVFPPSEILGPDTVCLGSTQKFSVPKVNNADNYVWALPAGWLVIGSASDDSITVMVGNAGGTITAKAKNSCNNSTSVIKTIAVYPQPTPVVVVNGADMHTGSYAFYQWLFHGTPIPGASDSNYTATKNGNYSVLVTDENGCTDTSNVVSIGDIGTGIDDQELAASISIYPNPAKEILHISSPVSVNVLIHDQVGKVVLKQQGVEVINIDQLPAGMYMVQIQDQSGKLLKTQKLMVDKQ